MVNYLNNDVYFSGLCHYLAHLMLGDVHRVEQLTQRYVPCQYLRTFILFKKCLIIIQMFMVRYLYFAY